jgi:hypothetical protein
VRTVHWRFAVALLVAAAVGGCVTAQNTLRREDVATFKLTSVAVKYASDASVNWEDPVRAYAKAKAIPDHELAAASSTPEASAFTQNFLASRVKTGVERHLSPRLAGTRPVRLDVVIRAFQIASPVQRVVIGGGYVMTADAVLVDARTGATIVAHPRLTANLPTGQGIVGAVVQAAYDASQSAPPADRVISTYAEQYGDWLLQK